MSDDEQWRAPDSPPLSPYAPATATPPAPGAAAPLPPPAGAPVSPPHGFAPPAAPPPPPTSGPGFAAPPGYAAHAAPPGWTPPPKPGLIPLRPLGLGTILAASFNVMRRNPRPTFGSALLIVGGSLILSLVGVGAVTFFAVDRWSSAGPQASDTVGAGSTALVVLSWVLVLVLTSVTLALLQGIIVLEVARGTLGEKLRFRGLWRRARGRIGALLGWMAIVVVAVVIAIVVFSVVVGLLVAFTGGTAGIAISIAAVIVAILASLVLGAWLTTKLGFVPSALLVERRSLAGAVARSWTLVRGHFWRVFGIQLLVAVMLSVATQVVGIPFQFVFMFAIGIFAPTGDFATAIVVLLVAYALLLLVTVVTTTVTAVVMAATSGLLYVDLRMRKEGFDLELARYVEARQAGQELTDPYLPAAHAGGSAQHPATATPRA